MRNSIIGYIFLLTIMFFAFPLFGHAQGITHVTGRVIDKSTKKPLPFVNVYFENRNIGTITDDDGRYEIKTPEASNKLSTSFLGFYTQTKAVTIGKTQVINFTLDSENISLNEVKVQSKKKKYRNKGNPAVELIKKVIDNKKLNRKENLSFYEYDRYEKVEFDINNVSDKLKNKKIFKKINFIFDYADTSALDGKVYLPIFLKESLSKVYYRKRPKTRKQYITGNKTISFHDFLDEKGIDNLMDYLYEDIDIYKSTVKLVTNDFISPIANIAPATYKFHIVDTIDIDGYNCINLVFYPRNKQSFAFQGNLFITNDTMHAVRKVDMKIMDDINLNFVKDVRIVQEWDCLDTTAWMLTKDNIDIIFSLTQNGAGVLGKKSVLYDNYIVNQPQPDSIYSGLGNVVKITGYDKRNEDFWEENRLTALTKKEQNIYFMTDSLKKVPVFKATMDIIMLFVAGYYNVGKVDIGRTNTFFSFNEIEGFRLRFGGRTSDKFSDRWKLAGFVKYGFTDQKLKYSGSAKYSFNKDRPVQEIPEHYLKATYTYDTKFPGLDLLFINGENFLLSFKRGVADKMVYFYKFDLEHFRDWPGGFSTQLNFKHVTEYPAGSLEYRYEDYSVNSITSSEVVTKVRYSPNEKYYRGLDYRVPIVSKEPIFQLIYTQGFNGVFDSEFTYSKFQFNFFKRFHVAPIGFTNLEIEAGKILGDEIPFPLLFVHRANQTYSYQLHSYNLMNFLEFVSDQYVAINAEHQFYGFFLNKIPLIKKLKWREVITFKGIYGGVSDKNNPTVTDGLMLFPTDGYGNQTTFTLEDKPYMEVGVGITNIFKILRIDFIKRLSYLNNPNVASWGIRGKFVLDF